MHHIKNVTVIMRMYCVTFRLVPSEAILEKEKIERVEDEDVSEKIVKKQKIE